jgi:phosphatidylserine/phosphatidylglycerophosphate/cardiolipin synthase-like enzyme
MSGVNRIKVYSNCDMATIAWMTDKPIQACRGFAIEREVSGPKGDAGHGFISTWVGFKGEKHKEGESQPSTIWPVQRYVWSDYVVSYGQKVRYRIIPMVGVAGKLKQSPETLWSEWSPWITIDTGGTKGMQAYFNRGIVPSQFLARQANTQKQFQQMLAQSINDPKNTIRRFLSGTLRVHLLDLLEQARKDGVQIYVALYELNDPELIAALKGLGDKCNVVLASGAYTAADKKKGTPAIPDENQQWRDDLKSTSNVKVFDRLVKSPHFAHNKFIVFCDKAAAPRTVWTGSTNWTVTGLCTQTNNGLLIADPKIALAFRNRWEELKKAKAAFPTSLATSGSTPATSSLGRSALRAWNVPCLGYADLKDAKKYIAGAKEGVLFLMFNPGTGDGKKKEKALIQDILDLDRDKLFVHGVLNQDPGGKKAPLIQLTHKGAQLKPVELPAILPKNLKAAGKNWFKSTFQYNMVMIHSKVVVIDPFGEKPIVMTGSHNMGPKASSSNDDNLVIIENAPGLAAEYAVYIMNVYGHYKSMFNQYLQAQGASQKDKQLSPQYDGNDDNDTWQERYLSPPASREMRFWLGK